MFMKILFAIYLILLILYVLYTGLNYFRIQAKGWMHPQVITNLTPFVLNVADKLSSFCLPISYSKR